MSHLPTSPAAHHDEKGPPAVQANGSHTGAQEGAGTATASSAEGTGERLRARLRSWLVEKGIGCKDPGCGKCMEYREVRVDEILEIFGYGSNGLLKAARVERGARAVQREVDRGMSALLGLGPSAVAEGIQDFDDLSDAVKLVYRRAALECVKAVRDA